MNIDVTFSKYLRRYEKHFGKENVLNSKYLILKKESSDGGYFGLFAYYISFASEIEYALANGMIPVVDMQNYKSSLLKDDEVGKVNAWEKFFEQPCGVGLEEALKSGKARYIWQDTPDYHPNDSLDCLYNDEILRYYNRIAKKYMRFKPEIQEKLEENYNSIIGGTGERCIGVLARGTDYSGLKPYYHPIQPTVEQMVPYIHKYMDRYECEKVFVATEDSTILEKMRSEFGDRLLYVDQKRVSKVDDFLFKNKEFAGVDPVKRTFDYLSAIYILSKCAGIVAGRTSGTVGACIMADDYKFKHIFTYGRYGLEDKIISNNVL